MKKFIVITSIFEPTEAVIKFSEIINQQLIVVGDKKTPKDWKIDNVKFLSIEEQEQMDFEIAKILPYNHYCRKMLGYLWAIKNNAEFIIDTDDDNIPKLNWGFPEMNSQYDYIPEDKGFINIYQLFTRQRIWARGLPLNLIKKDFKLHNTLENANCKVGVWQGLADEDPDVDAIYRLTSDEICHFSERPPVVLGAGTISPFNTQNTIITKELFPLMYLPTYVTFRFTDILRGLIFQPIMWLYGYNLGFVNATVIQKRNPHDYFKDFISEIPMYQHCEEIIDIVSSSISSTNNISDNLHNAYKALLQKSIICDKEMITLDAWLNDIQSIDVDKIDN